MMENRDEINVLLSVVGENQASGEGEPDVIRLVTTGQLKKTPQGHRLTYTETDPESGEGQDIVIDVSGKRVVMTRGGTFGTTMVFEKDRRFDGQYATPWGNLSMGIYTTRTDFSLSPEEGRLDLDYQVDLQGRYAAMHHLKLRFAPND